MTVYSMEMLKEDYREQKDDETEDSYHKFLCTRLANANGTRRNPENDLGSILEAHKASPCRRDKVLEHLRSVYRIDADASERLLGLDAKLAAMGEEEAVARGAPLARALRGEVELLKAELGSGIEMDNAEALAKLRADRAARAAAAMDNAEALRQLPEDLDKYDPKEKLADLGEDAKNKFGDAATVRDTVLEVAGAHHAAEVEAALNGPQGLDGPPPRPFSAVFTDAKVAHATNAEAALSGLEELDAKLAALEKPRHRCVTMATFNFKGGVGKTTMTINTAAALAKQGYRVGIVDADVQGSTTGYFFGSSEDAANGNDGGGDPGDHGDASGLFHELPRRADLGIPNLDSAVEHLPMLHDKLDVVSKNKQAAFEEQLRDDFFDMKHVSWSGGSLQLLCGGPDLAQIEKNFSTTLNSKDLGVNDGMLIGSFRVLLNRLAIKNKLDMILVDVGPSSSLFNAWLVMSCDYILPPAFPDKFSALSVRDFVRSVIPGFRDKQAYWLNCMWTNKDTIQRNKDYLFNPLTVVLPFMLGKLALNNADGTITAACAKWVYAIEDWLGTNKNARFVTNDKSSFMNESLLLHRYVPATREMQDEQKFFCTFLKELRSEIPVSQQLRIPLVSLVHGHLSKIGQAKTRVEYINSRYGALTNFLVKTWKNAPLRQVVSPAIGMDGNASGATKKRKLEDDAAAALEAIAAEPKRFRDLLSVLHTRANAVSGAICGGDPPRHGIGKKDGKRMLEDALTHEMVNGSLSLSEALHQAGFEDAVVFHQYTLVDGRPDIMLTNVNISGKETDNRPIIVEAKKRTGKAFDQPSDRKSNKNQVEEYRDELELQLDKPSPYSILFNFESNTTNVKFRWAKTGPDADGKTVTHWYDWAGPS